MPRSLRNDVTGFSYKMPNIHFQDLGLIDYQDAYEIQKRRVEEVLKGAQGTVFLCEHPTVLTMGRMADKANILATEQILNERGIPIHWIDRGGDTTLHAPGQLVIYPIFNLQLFKKDLHLYLRKLEEVAIDLLKRFGIVANRFLPQTGVWVGDKKIVSVGIGVRRWVTFHGLAVNVNTDLNLFRLIKPCGLDVTMTSIAAIKGQKILMEDVKEKLKDSFEEIFRLDLEGIRS